jgi:glycosyltransferase involved in cell wall biosynthesis
VRVAHLTTVDSSLRFLLYPQLRAVVELGGEALGISAPGPWVDGLERDGIRHIPLPSSTRGFDVVADLRAARDLYRVLRRERPDVLHTHNPKPGLYGRVLGRLVGVPIVVNTVHGLYATETDRLAKRIVVYALEAIASRFSDAELIQNPEDLALIERLRLAPREHAKLLGNGIDLTRFRPERFTPDYRSRVRAGIGVDDGEVLIGYVGRLVAEKGLLELFDAVRTLDKRCRLLIVGPEDRDKPDALPQSVIARARADGAIFLGQRDDVDELYAAMDMFALPSHREGFPRGPMEAAAMALPVVTTDVRGCREVVEHEVNGILVPVRDPAALASALQRLCDDPTLRGAMGSAGRRRALEMFDEKRCVDIVLATYRDVARAKRLTLA